MAWKRIILSIAVLVVVGGTLNAESSTKEGSKTLIVYLTGTGNTGAVAAMIHDEVGGDLVELELETPYPENYQAQVAQVVQEDRTGYLPVLKTAIRNFADYRTVFMGFPTWNMQLPPPIRSFLNKFDLRGKTVVPFNTNGGYGVGSGFEEIKKFVPNSVVLAGFSVEGGRERDGILFVMHDRKEFEVRGQVQAWLTRIGLR